jgi:hypothetical protein
MTSTHQSCGKRLEVITGAVSLVFGKEESSSVASPNYRNI